MRNSIKQRVLLGLVSLFAASAIFAAQPGTVPNAYSMAADSYIKPHAPVDVSYKVFGPAVPGRPVDIEIMLRPNKMAEAVSSNIRTGERMSMLRRGNVRRISKSNNGAMNTRQVITLMPEVAGIHYVTVFASVQMQGKLQTRVVALPVQVGNSSVPVQKFVPAMGELKQEADGGMVRSLPAQETFTSKK